MQDRFVIGKCWIARIAICVLYVLTPTLCLARPEGSATMEDKDSADFITASLLIVQPDKSSLITYFGHTSLRLQCPSSGLDYCFTFDSFTSGNYWNLLTGKERTQLVPIDAASFFAQYKGEHRKVYEYILNLTLEEERELWRLVDYYVELGPYMQTDFVNHGCAGETASIVFSVIKGRILFPETLGCLGDTQQEIIAKYMDDNTWLQLPPYLLSAHDVHRKLQLNEERLMLPTILLMICKEITIADDSGNTRSLFADNGLIVHNATRTPLPESSFPGPENVALALLAIAVVVSLLEYLTRKRIKGLSCAVDTVLMLIQGIVGLTIMALMLCSSLPTTSGWNWNFIVFNPLPLAIWICTHPVFCPKNGLKVRQLACGVFSLVAAAFLVVMLLNPHFFDRSQYYFVAALIVRASCTALAQVSSL